SFEELVTGCATLIDIAQAAENELHDGRGLQLFPRIRGNPALFETPMVNDPFTLKEIEVVRSLWEGGMNIGRDSEERHDFPLHLRAVQQGCPRSQRNANRSAQL